MTWPDNGGGPATGQLETAAYKTEELLETGCLEEGSSFETTITGRGWRGTLATGFRRHQCFGVGDGGASCGCGPGARGERWGQGTDLGFG